MRHPVSVPGERGGSQQRPQSPQQGAEFRRHLHQAKQVFGGIREGVCAATLLRAFAGLSCRLALRQVAKQQNAIVDGQIDQQAVLFCLLRLGQLALRQVVPEKLQFIRWRQPNCWVADQLD
jgi:hypothetical protein